MKHLSKWIFGIVILAIIGFAAYALTRSDEQLAETTVTSSSEGSKNYYGNLESPVTLTEYVDFQCEACYAYYPFVKELKEKYKDRVKFQIKYFPIASAHKLATQAAQSAEAAARQDKFFEMHDKLFAEQKIWEQLKDPTSQFEKYAKDIGLDVEKYKSDSKSDEVQAVVKKDLADATALKASGTPTFVLNGKMIENPGPSLEALSKVLDDALAANTKQ